MAPLDSSGHFASETYNFVKTLKFQNVIFYFFLAWHWTWFWFFNDKIKINGTYINLRPGGGHFAPPPVVFRG